ncbi:MAG: ATP-binding protein [Cyanobacteriota bacterium]
MTTQLKRWQVRNDEYLAAAINWLRLRLKGVVQSNDLVMQEEIDEAEKGMAAAADCHPPPALILLSQQLGLSDFERSLLLLCVAMELDTRIAELCAEAQDNRHRPYPTFALALACFDNPTWNVLLSERPLRYWRLIEIHQSGVQPLITSPLRADERIVNYIKGLNYLDDRLSALVFPLNPWEGQERNGILPLPASGQQVADAIAHEIKQAFEQQQYPILQLTGIDTPTKKYISWLICQEFGLNLYRLPVELLPTQGTELEALARLWQRESLLLPLALYIDVQSLDEVGSTGGMSALRRFLSRSQGIFFLDVRESGLALERPTVTFDVGKPTPVEQREAWELVLGTQAEGIITSSPVSLNPPQSPRNGGRQEDEAFDLRDEDSTTPLFKGGRGDRTEGQGKFDFPSPNPIPAQLANQFHLNLLEIGKIAGNAQSEGENSQESLAQQLWNGCLASTRPRLDTLAQRLEVKATWDDIVLPPEELELLHQIAEQVQHRGLVYDEWGFRQRMNRGLGVSALFAGESGTGKTMAAEVIANDLRLNLYRIDLSAVVSKYIGETEKNLRRLFDAAEDGGAILFFDEADALFGKRSEVKDSHDRYANIEINYLLQRLEAYRGLAILATNIKSALDVAFMRRLRFIVSFPFPGLKERRVMWQKVFPQQTPTEELDFHRLAQFNLTGASIHNIALNAAFLAAKAGTPVRMEWVLTAARTEFRKLDKPINEADFRV